MLIQGLRPGQRESSFHGRVRARHFLKVPTALEQPAILFRWWAKETEATAAYNILASSFFASLATNLPMRSFAKYTWEALTRSVLVTRSTGHSFKT